MKNFTAKAFSIPVLKGVSAKTNEEHLKLYAGYVKNTNSVIENLSQLNNEYDKNAYTIGELNRRFAFEWNGMRNHEIYFSSLEKGSRPLPKSATIKRLVETEYGSFDAWLTTFKNTALTRGTGWAVLSYNKKSGSLFTSWIDEQHLGQLNDCTTILALDMWEHSYIADYQPSGKKEYIEDFFTNLDWQTIEKNLIEAI